MECDESDLVPYAFLRVCSSSDWRAEQLVAGSTERGHETLAHGVPLLSQFGDARVVRAVAGAC